MSPSFEASSRGSLMNYYIAGYDDLINVADSMGSSDNNLWYFEAPSSYLGNQGIAYGGTLTFCIGAFSGDFSAMNPPSTNVVELICDECPGPISKGIRLGFSMTMLANSTNSLFTGRIQQFRISLHESAGWTKDPQNTLANWIPASSCDMVQVLSRLSRIRILDDYTRWKENVGIDNTQ
jgi:hypothetical protein